VSKITKVCNSLADYCQAKKVEWLSSGKIVSEQEAARAGARRKNEFFVSFFEICQKKFAQRGFMCDNVYTSLTEASVRPQASSEDWVFLFYGVKDEPVLLLRRWI
jgi:hypothetical protein